MLIVFGGLPGTGKSTIARAIAQQRPAVYLRIDTIEQALRGSDVLRDDVGAAGYRIACALAEANLRLGATVIADSVNPLAITRAAWRRVASEASARIVEIETICSDAAEHRRRIETRPIDVPELPRPSWADVMNRDYQSWDRPRLVLDTASLTVAQAVACVRAHLDGWAAQPVNRRTR